MANAVFAGAARQLVSNVSPLATTLRVVPAGEHEGPPGVVGGGGADGWEDPVATETGGPAAACSPEGRNTAHSETPISTTAMAVAPPAAAARLRGIAHSTTTMATIAGMPATTPMTTMSEETIPTTAPQHSEESPGGKLQLSSRYELTRWATDRRLV